MKRFFIKNENFFSMARIRPILLNHSSSIKIFFSFQGWRDSIRFYDNAFILWIFVCCTLRVDLDHGTWIREFTMRARISISRQKFGELFMRNTMLVDKVNSQMYAIIFMYMWNNYQSIVRKKLLCLWAIKYIHQDKCVTNV